MSLSLIAAIGKNNELGKNNDLIWHLPNDLKFFKETTTGKTVVMGENTFKSLPKMLPNRKHIVLSIDENFNHENVEIFRSINDFLKKYKDCTDEIFIIGGASIYKQFIDLVDTMYLTEIDAECNDASVYFPKFDKLMWNREELLKNSDNGINYVHVKYTRKEH